MYRLDVSFMWSSPQAKLLILGTPITPGLFYGRKAKIKLKKEAEKSGYSFYQIIKETSRVIHRVESEDIHKLKNEIDTYRTKTVEPDQLKGISKIFFKDKKVTVLDYFENVLGVLMAFDLYKDGEKIEY